ncbi:MAG: hypothetical protein JWM93_3370 [Frankiales bacterium]|nr:hypothetical protein [Frankiales bacterium]
MSMGRHERLRESTLLPAAGWACALTGAVLAALTSDARYLRLAVVLALAAVVPHALSAARAPRRAEVRALRREVVALRSAVTVRETPIVEIVVVPSSAGTLGASTTVNGSAHPDTADSRRLVLDLVALEVAAATDGR